MILARAGALDMPHAMVRVELQNTPRPLFRETEAIVRREIGGIAWHIRLTAPGDLLDPLGRDAISGLANRLTELEELVAEQTGRKPEGAEIRRLERRRGPDSAGG